MASLFFLSFLSLVLSLSSATNVPPAIRQACKATRFPIPCETSLTLSQHAPSSSPTSLQLIQSAISISSDNLHTAQSKIKSILDSSAGNQNRTTAAKNCLDFLHIGDYRISQTAKEALPHGRVKDARAWMSSALQFQFDCWSALNKANDTKTVNETISFMDSLTGLTSNALSMLFAYDVYGKDTGSWALPKTERDGFWERNGGSGGSIAGFKGGVPTNLKADVTVCKDASKGGCYKTVQEAVNAAPNGGKRRFVIYIKEGVYEETVRVPLEKKNVVFLGDGMGKTVITGSLNVGQPGISTYNSATVG
jgi:pectinesterase inhibitor-like protein